MSSTCPSSIKTKTAERPNSKGQKLLGGLFVPIIIAGFFYPWVGLSILACMIAGMVIAIKKGRKWCDWWCPRGSFLDYYVSRFSKQKPLPKWFYDYRFRLTFITLLFSFLTFNIYKAWPSFAGIGFAFVRTITLTTILSLILAYFFRARSWCVVCPVGTFSSLIGAGKMPLHVSFAKCLSCTSCAVVCPMGLEPFKDSHHGQLQSNDCIKCESCVTNCPTNALTF